MTAIERNTKPAAEIWPIFIAKPFITVSLLNKAIIIGYFQEKIKIFVYNRSSERDENCKKSWKMQTERVQSGAMKFVLIDKITELDSGKRIRTVKSVSLAEEYLGDHFPTFPVLPGVLLLEGLIESASWLVREKTGFGQSMVLLEQARNVKYKSFAAPGMQIVYEVTAGGIEENVSRFTGVGTCGDEAIVEAKFTLRHFNLADENPAMAAIDGEVVEAMRRRWVLLYPAARKAAG